MRKFAPVLAVLLLSGSAGAETLFSDDFEGSLSQWTGKSGGAHSGLIVADPINPSNHVLVFSDLNAAGDVFSPEVEVFPFELYVLSFDYLGVAKLGSPDGNFGGFIGIADETSGLNETTVQFVGGTCLDEGNIEIDIADDGTWHSYSVAFFPYEKIAVTDGAIHVTVEDWLGAPGVCSMGVPGDAYFDNIRLERAGPVSVKPTTWGAVKALYR